MCSVGSMSTSCRSSRAPKGRSNSAIKVSLILLPPRDERCLSHRPTSSERVSYLLRYHREKNAPGGLLVRPATPLYSSPRTRPHQMSGILADRELRSQRGILRRPDRGIPTYQTASVNIRPVCRSPAVHRPPSRQPIRRRKRTYRACSSSQSFSPSSSASWYSATAIAPPSLYSLRWIPIAL